jgi:hypothetical protein
MRTLAIVAVLAVAGCAGGSHILTGKARPPTSPEAVKVYSAPPASFEEIAIIDASSKDSWAVTDQGRADVVLQRMKEAAAAVGANGLLLTGYGDGIGGSVGTATRVSPGTSIGYSAPASRKFGQGRAIYVIAE